MRKAKTFVKAHNLESFDSIKSSEKYVHPEEIEARIFENVLKNLKKEDYENIEKYNKMLKY